MNILLSEILIKDYTYALTQEKIAEFPLQRRDSSKLLIYKRGQVSDDHFGFIPDHLPPNSALILNNTRVIEARLFFQKPTGGIVEIFCLEPHGQSMEQALQQREGVIWKCLIGGASKWKAGQILQKEFLLEDNTVFLSAEYIDKKEDYFLIQFRWYPDHLSFVQIIHEAGAIPLPPYIKRNADKIDAKRYQTVFGKYEGSVAAPTAALHFTEEILNQLKAKKINTDYITLHIGAGTFKPVKTETIAEHQMHSEPFTVTKELLQTVIDSTNIIAAGTTSLRTVESLYWLGLKLNASPETELELSQWEAYKLAEQYPIISYEECFQKLIGWMEIHSLEKIHCRTSLIIVPGYQFKVVSGLITNFHQPQSTLLLLVAAFIGEDWKNIYQHALDNGYRFLSYGDSSLLWRKD